MVDVRSAAGWIGFGGVAWAAGQAIANRDLIVVRNCVMLLAAMVVLVNFVVDLLYAVIDPRIQAHDI